MNDKNHQHNRIIHVPCLHSYAYTSAIPQRRFSGDFLCNKRNDNISLQEVSLTTPNQSHHLTNILPHKFFQSQNKKEIEQLQIRKMVSAITNHYSLTNPRV
jgi:hypothetical protein